MPHSRTDKSEFLTPDQTYWRRTVESLCVQLDSQLEKLRVFLTVETCCGCCFNKHNVDLIR